MKNPSVKGTGEGASEVPVGPLVLSGEARAQLERLEDRDQRRVGVLMRAAGTDLQREMLQRALACGHDPAELEAFADAIRPMDDRRVFTECTLTEADAAAPRSLTERLRAGSDPVYAFRLHGHPLWGGDEATPRPAAPVGEVWGPELEERLSGAVRPLGLAYQGVAVDVGSVSLEEALEEAAAALEQGVPLPVCLGERPGDASRSALLLQVAPGESREFQLHEPLLEETRWVPESELRGRADLGFSDPRLKRVTVLCLPRPHPKRK